MSDQITKGLLSIVKIHGKAVKYDDHAFMVACFHVFMKIFNAKEMLSQITIFHHISKLCFSVMTVNAFVSVLLPYHFALKQAIQ